MGKIRETKLIGNIQILLYRYTMYANDRVGNFCNVD